MSDAAIEVTVVMPCLNEAETVATCIAKARAEFDRLGIIGEIIVADNGSTDNSVAIAKAAGARVVAVLEKGYGAAIAGGIAEARGTFIIMGDADDSYDFGELGKFVEPLRQGCEFVMGCRLPSGGGRIIPGAMPWMHEHVGTPVLTAISRLFFRTQYHDNNCGMRGFRGDLVDRLDLHTTGMEFASEMVIKAALLDVKSDEVPITLHHDGRTRSPHLRSWRDGWRHLRFMLLFSPLWLFIYPGLAMLGIGFAVVVMIMIAPVRIGSLAFSMNSQMMGAALALIGFQLIGFGIFTKAFVEIEGLTPNPSRIVAFVYKISLEFGILLGLAGIFIGISIICWAILEWRDVGFGELTTDVIRSIIPATLLIMLSVQIIFSKFVLDVLKLKRRRV